MSYSDRFKELRLVLKKSQEEFAELTGISRPSVYRIEKNDSEIGIGVLEKLRNHGINVDWLITGNGVMFLNSEETALAKKEDVVYVRKLGIEAAAGVGIINYPEDEQPVWVGLPASFIYPYSPFYISLLLVSGNSMEPTMRHGDILLVSEQERRIQSENIYIIRIGEELKVKRIDILANKNIVILSENPQYGRQEFTPQEWQDYSIEIVARVIKVIKNV